MRSSTRRARGEARPSRPEVEGRGSADDLARIRRRIDALDDRILELLERRAELALRAGAVKARTGGAAYVPEREREVLARIARGVSGPLPAVSARAIYREILRASRALEGSLFGRQRGRPERVRRQRARPRRGEPGRARGGK